MFLARFDFPEHTSGRLYIDTTFECYTLEDKQREVKGQPVSAWKVPGKTAIPRGTYGVQITFSNRFKRELPLLLNVPGFEGVRIHPGNTAADTEGCILVGDDEGADGFLGQSRQAFDRLFRKIRDAIARGDQVTITLG